MADALLFALDILKDVFFFFLSLDTQVSFFDSIAV